MPVRAKFVHIFTMVWAMATSSSFHNKTVKSKTLTSSDPWKHLSGGGRG